MIRILFTALMLLSVTIAQSQVRADSLMLSVYHLGTKYRLTPSTFGPHIVSEDLLGEMTMAYDTLLIRVPFGLNEAAGESLTGWKVQHDCEKISSNLKDKVVIMNLNGNCDPSYICLKVQREGAKALILIHYKNDKDSIELKSGNYVDSIKIPCFTIRHDVGKLMTTQLPAIVGIKKPDIMPDDAMALKAPNNINNNPIVAQNKKEEPVNQQEITKDKDTLSDKEKESLNKALLSSKFALSPNPTQDISYLQYNLSEITDLYIELRNVNNQIIQNKTLKSVQLGTHEISTTELSNGIYFVVVRQNKETTMQKLVVQH